MELVHNSGTDSVLFAILRCETPDEPREVEALIHLWNIPQWATYQDVVEDHDLHAKHCFPAPEGTVAVDRLTPVSICKIMRAK